eukprot:jgi/Astpho2/4694/Aster-00253
MSSPAWWQNADLACLSFSLQQLLTCSASCLQPQSYQQTLKQSFLLGGVGLHTGEYATVRIMPAMAGEGRYFVRVPQGEQACGVQPGALAAARQPACTHHLQSPELVHSVEALLSALEQSGVDNARIEIEGGHEIPVVDGSAMGWVIETQKAGLVPAPIKDKASGKLDRLLEAPTSVVMVREGDAFVTFYPERAQRVTCGIDHIGEAMIIGKQWMSWAPAEDEPYRWSLSPARNYYTHPQQVLALYNEGYLKGGTDDASVIGFRDRWYRPKDVRFYDDEPIRHRLCDLLGDLALLAKNGNAGMPRGHVVAYKANHALHIKFLRELSKIMT